MTFIFFSVVKGLETFIILNYSYLADMEDLRQFSKSQGAPEASELTHWDTTFWSERLRESKYEINEVLFQTLFTKRK